MNLPVLLYQYLFQDLVFLLILFFLLSILDQYYLMAIHFSFLAFFHPEWVVQYYHFQLQVERLLNYFQCQ
ncbi:MAG: hypothetical protein C0594_00185 [Marinilabiliales bacterium]|nr:MAG: hypothetical protein C0594_00185 [Marinilabiliales bacterium]